MLKEEGSFANLSRKFSMVRNYVYEGQGNLEDFGILKNDATTYTIYILQDRNHKELAYRIYRDFRRENFDEARDAVLIQRLYENSYGIQNIDFPYGVVTKENRIIGQVIPYYEDAKELANYKDDIITSATYLVNAYSLVKELYDHDIYYLDIHEHNFLVTKQGLKLIDFDNEMTRFHSHIYGLNNLYERHIVKNFQAMVHTLLGYGYGLINVDSAATIEELGEEVSQIYENRQKIKIKKQGLNF